MERENTASRLNFASNNVSSWFQSGARILPAPLIIFANNTSTWQAYEISQNYLITPLQAHGALESALLKG